MKKFIFIMQHALTPEQKSAVGDREIVEIADKALLNVPEDPNLGREWFATRAEEIISAVGGISEGDTLHVMGQQQLAMAVSALGRKAGAGLVESCTKRDSVEKTLPDGKVVKTNVFTFTGFRTVHAY